MTDTEKERELPKEGMDMNNEKILELGEKKESSIAADQESVTGNQNPNNSINGSSNEGGGSSKQESGLPRRQTALAYAKKRNPPKARRKTPRRKDGEFQSQRERSHSRLRGAELPRWLAIFDLARFR